jgi:stage IV sporulation protein B
MKKRIILIALIVIGIVANYWYYESKTTEVFLIGKVVGFDIAEFQNDDDNNSKIVSTSTKSVGTITFANSNNKFSALGHAISSKINKEQQLTGKCYEIYFDYVKKASENEVGRIIADINENKVVGEIEKCSEYGMYGIINEISEYPTIQTGNRYDIKKENASIVIDFDGNGLKEYEVEIIEINYLSKTQNIKINVKSDELINISGGVAQGMSGAPLIQDGKLIGAINYVNNDNALEAYAIFIDKLL